MFPVPPLVIAKFVAGCGLDSPSPTFVLTPQPFAAGEAAALHGLGVPAPQLKTTVAPEAGPGGGFGEVSVRLLSDPEVSRAPASRGPASPEPESLPWLPDASLLEPQPAPNGATRVRQESPRPARPSARRRSSDVAVRAITAPGS